jgi:hypothetical protein
VEVLEEACRCPGLTEVNGPVAIQENLFGREVNDDVQATQRGRPEEMVIAEGLVEVGRVTDAAPRQVRPDDGGVPAESASHADLEVGG